jgi:beta-lactamase class A
MKKIFLTTLIILAAFLGMLVGKNTWDSHIYAQSSDPYAPLKAAVENFLRTSPNTGVLIVLPTGETISNKTNDQFPAYSVIKLWIAAAVFADAKDRGTTVDSNTLSLVQRMLQNSDNAATNELLTQLGDCSNAQCDPRIKQFAAENNYSRTYIQRRMLETPIRPENDNLTSPQDAVNFMQNLVSGNIVDSETSQLLASILAQRTQSGTDPFKPNAGLPASAGFIGKSGVMQSLNSYNDVGTFLDAGGNRIYFAIFAPTGGVGADQTIAKIEQLAYNPAEQPKDISTTGPNSTSTGIAGGQTTITGRVCVKIGNPTEPKPAICNQPTTTTAPGGGGLSGCPVIGKEGRIMTGSFYSKIGTSQHCNAASGYSPACDPNSRRGKSIDVPTSPGEYAILPTINGQILSWKYLQTYPDGLGGLGHVFRATDSTGTNWDLQLLHQQAVTFTIGQSYPSGTQASLTDSKFDHVHVTIGKNIKLPEGNCTHSTDPNVCNLTDPGWLNPDTDMGMCMK